MYYNRNRKLARTINTEPTATDQSQARESDINVIVGRFLRTGVAPGAPLPTLNGVDWTNFPNDLRGFIETGRRIDEYRAALPQQLREMPTEQILSLKPDELTNILKPPAPTPAQPTGDGK